MKNGNCKLDSQSEKRRFECQDCGKSYHQMSDLKFHVKNICGKNPRFECIECGKIPLNTINSLHTMMEKKIINVKTVGNVLVLLEL